jgi:beta-lactamase class A
MCSSGLYIVNIYLDPRPQKSYSGPKSMRGPIVAKMHVFLIWFAASGTVFAQTVSKDIGSLFCNVILPGKAYDYQELFTESFVNAISEEKFRLIVEKIFNDTGSCVSVNSESEKLLVQTEFDVELMITFKLNEDGKISSFFFREMNYWPGVETLDELTQGFNLLDGELSLYATDFGERSFSLNHSNKAFPVGSVFKLYVLGALSDYIESGLASWDTPLQIQEELKTLPRSSISSLPQGTSISLRELATQMISVSDNTATDHLIHYLGKDSVEKQLSKMGNSFPEMSIPFLTTQEWAKIKWVAPIEVQQRYLAADADTKRELLFSEIKNLSVSDVGANGLSLDRPQLIHELEWFASTKDMCEAMHYLKNLNSEAVDSILSVNTAGASREQWSYVGYKGGSETGVAAAVYLLKDKNEILTCVAGAIANPKKSVPTGKFVRGILKTADLWQLEFGPQLSMTH